MTSDRYALLTAARVFLRLLREADDATFDLAYQTLATEANGSEYGQSLEPRQGLCVAMQAETARRAYDAGATIDEDAYSAACDERSYGEDDTAERDEEAQRLAWHARIDAARTRSNRRHGITTDAYKGADARNAVARTIRAARPAQ